METFNFKPIIIIGAARSGTNMLRDVLTSLYNFATWPCDEINYIWRYGNKKREDDEFDLTDVSKKNRKFIRKQFMNFHNKVQTDYIVEKTCANSLRVDFVDEIIPEAKYIHIYRNPIDVSASAKKRWKASLDLMYVLKKARYVPFQDVPYYAIKYLNNRIKRLFNNENKLDYWGPKFKGFKEITKNKSLIETCAIQWKKSVKSSLESFDNINNDRVYHISYENFVINPLNELSEIINYINPELNNKKELKEAVKNVSPKSIEKGYKELDEKKIKTIEEITKEAYKKVKRYRNE